MATGKSCKQTEPTRMVELWASMQRKHVCSTPQILWNTTDFLVNRVYKMICWSRHTRYNSQMSFKYYEASIIMSGEINEINSNDMFNSVGPQYHHFQMESGLVW